MLVSFDIKFIRRDQKQRRNGEACREVVKNTMLVSFDIKFIRRGQKQRRNGAASLAIPTLFLASPDKLDIKGHLRGFTFLVYLLKKTYSKPLGRNVFYIPITASGHTTSK